MKTPNKKFILAMLGTGLVAAAASSAWAQNPALVAYWNFDDDSNPAVTLDQVYGLPGMLEGNTVFTDDAHSGKAVDFFTNPPAEGEKNLVRVLNTSTLNVAAAEDQLTISFWQKLSTVASSSAFWGVSPSSSGSQRGIQAHVPWGNGNIYFDTAGCCNGGTQRISGAPDTDFTDGWHHLAFVKNGATKQIWIDGVLFLEGQNTLPLPSDFTQFIMGAGFTAPTMQGALDDFAIYQGALTEAQIGQLASGVAPDQVTGVETIPPVAPAITEQPRDVTTVAGSPATFTVAIEDGAFPDPEYQWAKNGEAIEGATGPSYTIDRVADADNGAQFTCTVRNAGGEVTSTAATLTVTPDTEAPTLEFVTGSMTFDQVVVTFSEPVDPATAEVAGNYQLSGGLSVTGAALSAPAGTPGDNVVVLTTSQQTPDTMLTLTVNNVTDVAGNPIAADSTMEFSTFVWQQGVVLHQFWDNVSGSLDGFAADPRFPNSPTWTSLEPRTEWPPNGSNNSGYDNYGDRLICWITPPEDGQYVLYINGDDDEELYLSTDENPANKKRVAIQIGWSGPRKWNSCSGDGCTKNSLDYLESEWPTGWQIELKAGQRYYLETRHTEGGGGDHHAATMGTLIDVGFKPADGDPPIFEGALVGTYLDPNGASVDITEPPQDTTAEQSRTATFTVTATGTSAYGDTVTYQWQMAPKGSSTFADIEGATGASYTTPLLTLADDGNQYRVICSVPTLDQASDVAVLTVTPDTEAPEIVSVGALSGDDQLGLQFNELLDPASAENPNNYTVAGGLVTGATLHQGTIVQLDLSGTVTGNFSVTVNGVTDLAGNAVTDDTVNGTAVAMTGQDVGDPGVDPLQAGDSFAFADNGFYVTAGGSDMWNAADGFHYVWKQFTGAFDMRARVQFLEGPNTWTKAGIMMRQSLDAGSRHAMVIVTRTAGQNVYVMQWRDATDDVSGSQPGASRPSPVRYPNAWIRLVREDANSNEIKSYIDVGNGWEPLYSHTLPSDVEGLIPETVYLGMTVTAHDNGDGVPLAEAIFQDFSIEEYQPIVDPQLAISAEDGNVTITWQGDGVLQSADAVTGPFEDVADATSPYTVAPTGTAKFYRVKQ